MALFWDSSAILPLVFDEAHSPEAWSAWRSGEDHVAWNWMEVETHAALVRRNANEDQFVAWKACLDKIFLLGMAVANHRSVMKKNKEWELPSADAGHVYLFQAFHRNHRNTKMVTFDREMERVCEDRGWPIWTD